MRTCLSRSLGAAIAAAGLTLLSLSAATSANAETLSAAKPGPARALTPARPSAAASQGWQQLLEIRNANLYTIAAVGQNVWVGGYRSLSGIPPLLEHWDGSTWHAVALPARIGGIDLVTASSPANVWIFGLDAGKFQAAHWNGHRWQIDTPEGIQFDQAAVTLGPADTWVFGGSATGHPVAAHFTASGWHTSQLGIDVDSVSAVSGSDIWAFGSTASELPTSAQWNGHSWAYHSVPRAVLPAGFPQFVPGGIHAFRPADAWAVGTAGTPNNQLLGVPMVLHWNGRSWRRAYAGPAGNFGSLQTITADGHHDLWMTSQFITGQHQLLHEHHGVFTWVPGPPLNHDQFFATDLTWLPGTPTLLFTGFLASETTVQYGHVEAYTP